MSLSYSSFSLLSNSFGGDGGELDINGGIDDVFVSFRFEDIFE